MAWVTGYYVVSYSMLDDDNARTGFTLLLPGTAAIADAVAFVTGFGDLLVQATDAMVEKLTMTLASTPDNIPAGTPIESPIIGAENARKASLGFVTAANAIGDTNVVYLEIPNLDSLATDGGTPPQGVLQSDGRYLNINNTNVLGLVQALAPTAPAATDVVGCDINKNVYASYGELKKYHRENAHTTQRSPAG